MVDKKNLAVVFLMGPTACGKTAQAARLCEQMEVELVSVDATQVYRRMNIGSGKPNGEFLRRYPHHLVDIREPSEAYSAAQFRDDGRRVIDQIHARGKLPVLTGGTMFYFAALENGLSVLPPADATARAQLGAETAQLGLPAMHAQLRRIDPKLAAAIAAADAQRILRALEIHRLTARRPSAVMAQSAAAPLPYTVLKIGLFMADRRALHARIEARFGAMLERGLVDEVRALAAESPPASAPARRAVGYRQVRDYLAGRLSYAAMVERSMAATRQLAKRQLTWMRQQKNLVWVDVSPPSARERPHEQHESWPIAAAGICRYLRSWLK